MNSQLINYFYLIPNLLSSLFNLNFYLQSFQKTYQVFIFLNKKIKNLFFIQVNRLYFIQVNQLYFILVNRLYFIQVNLF
jgi:hypothetical protein